MIILGVHDGHDAGAVLFKGDKIYAVNEERLNRIKKYRGFPRLSVRKVLELGEVSPEEVDAIAVAGLFRRRNRLLELENELKSVFGSEFRKKVIFVEHHLAHASSAYYTSGLSDAIVLTIDAAGDGLSSTVSIARKGEMFRIAQSTYIDSLGDFYASVTELLGFKPMRHEGKVMSLAAYGKPSYELSAVIEVSGLSFENKLKVIGVEATKKLAEFFSFPLDKAKEVSSNLKRGFMSGKLERKAIEIAASAQAHLERLIEEMGLELRKYNLPIAYAGGVAQNVKANAVLRGIFGDIWVFPAMDDAGLAFGAAAYIKAQMDILFGKWKPFKLEHVFLGPYYSLDFVEDVLKREKLEYEEVDVPSFVSDSLVDGKIVGLFQGELEYGPRALGHRSILADPRDEKVKEKLNLALKRDVFQPFAPSILEEDFPKYIEDLTGEPNRFMTMSYKASDEFVEVAPAVVHVDGTTRPQSVPEWLGEYYEIIRKFKEKSGVGAVLNTSFNMHGEPIVCSPRDAIRTAKIANLDVLVLEDFAVYPK
ncbi:carbamoyltransferase family protein [Pyrococcus abyssi]|uniref:Carbamoyl transferase related protein n=1 Tax=Pyrococcus abyssi (strain GE5 / Orsay) TaxID=272844 RepID=Q9UZK5_PYRAB|nr:carbamoyltransferase [Pyrococcus abyssi]CAB50052.1 Putative carbamoyl transferase, nodU family [Pyrococcus abyssi GE5]CCE70556.1 TPA: carbamoyl transferase related protein [Pyrococcus abyssi GE5]